MIEVHLKVIVTSVNSVLRGRMEMELYRFEDLVCPQILVHNEFTFNVLDVYLDSIS